MRQHQIGAATVKGDPLPQKRKPSPAARGTQRQEIAIMSENYTDPAADTGAPVTQATIDPVAPASAEPVAVESAPEAAGVEAAPVAVTAAPAGDALPTVADFIAPIGGAAGRGEVALDAKALEVSFTRSGGDVSFSVKAETVTLTGKRG